MEKKFFEGDWVFDIETFPNTFTFAAVYCNGNGMRVFEISDRKNEVEEARRKFEEETGDTSGFTPEPDECEETLKGLLNVFKEKKAKLLEQQEKVKEENLLRKKSILEEIKKITEDSDNINKHYNDFQQLQQAFKEIGTAATAGTLVTPVGVGGTVLFWLGAGASAGQVAMSDVKFDTTRDEVLKALSEKGGEAFFRDILGHTPGASARATAIVNLSGGWDAFVVRFKTDVLGIKTNEAKK